MPFLRSFFIFLFKKDSIFVTMEKFEVHILGCGSALPTTRHFATSQVVNIREKLFMIDCGEGAQMQLRKSKLKFTRLNHIFISHLSWRSLFRTNGTDINFRYAGKDSHTLYSLSCRIRTSSYSATRLFFAKV